MKVLPGLGWGDASGSVGALTISHNKGGLYMRSRTVPTNPNSEAQQQARESIQVLSQTWGTLTGSQRTQWEDFALSNPVVGPLGETITLSGEQMYVRCNQRLQVYGFSLIAVPPVNMSASIPDAIGLVVDTSPAFAITFTTTEPSDVYVRMTPPLSPGITNVKKYLRTLGIFDVATLGADVTTAYAARFGSLTVAAVGKRVSCELAGFTSTNGQISVLQPGTTIVI